MAARGKSDCCAASTAFPVDLSWGRGLVRHSGSDWDWAQQPPQRRARHRCGLQEPGRPTSSARAERLDLEDLRQQFVGTAQTLKQNQA